MTRPVFKEGKCVVMQINSTKTKEYGFSGFYSDYPAWWVALNCDTNNGKVVAVWRVKTLKAKRNENHNTKLLGTQFLYPH